MGKEFVTMFVEKTIKVYVEVKAVSAADAKRAVDEMQLEPVKTGFGIAYGDPIKVTWSATKPRWVAKVCVVCGGKQFSMRESMCGICRMREMGAIQ